MSRRDQIIRLADDAARDPSRAATYARMIDRLLASSKHDTVPGGYVYHGAMVWNATSEQVEIEALPTEENPGRPTVWQTANEAIPIKVPFDALIQGVSGWGIINPVDNPEQGPANLFTGCGRNDGRDLFAVDWGLDGQVDFSSDGRDRQMYPAAVVVGTRNRPRPLAWTVRRNQTIRVRIRSLLNVLIDPDATPEGYVFPTLTAWVGFHALNLEAP